MSVAERLLDLRREVPEGISIVAVSKFKPIEDIREAYEAGQRLFGESRVQELLQKISHLPSDIEWHFIGHLQTNKVRQIVGKVALIQSVDSERLLALIDEESRKAGVVTRVLLQVHVALEETKFGFSGEELIEYFREKRHHNLTNTHICGLMAMASNTEDVDRVRYDFRAAADIFREIKNIGGDELRGFDVLSMGMSHDWPLAVEEGADMIRVGSTIFGNR